MLGTLLIITVVALVVIATVYLLSVLAALKLLSRYGRVVEHVHRNH